MAPALSDDLLYQIATHLVETKDVLALALTSKTRWELLQHELLSTDIEYDHLAVHGHESCLRQTALHHAVLKGNLERVQTIVSLAKRKRLGYIGDYYKEGPCSASALGHAIRLGHEQIAHIILAAHPAQAMDTFYHVSIVEPRNDIDFLFARSEICFQTHDDDPRFVVVLGPLALATLFGHQALAKTLLSTAQPAEIDVLVYDICRVHAVEIACLMDDRSIIPSLVTQPRNTGSAEKYLDDEYPELFASVPLTALAVVGRTGGVDLVEYLLRHNIDPDAFGRSGRTAMFYAASIQALDESLYLLQVPGSRAPFWDYEGRGILDIAAADDAMLPVTERLIQTGRMRPFQVQAAIKSAQDAGAKATKTIDILRTECIRQRYLAGAK